MSDMQQTILTQDITAAEASVDARAAFLKKTYTWLLIGILGFCGVVAAVPHVPFLADAAVVIRSNFLVTIVVLFGMTWFAHSVAEKPGLNVVAYALYVVMFGLLIAPFIMLAGDLAPNAVSQASTITGLIFLGLTAYVFISGKDFSWMGGALAIGLFAMIGIAVAGWLFGFGVGIWYSVFGALLMSGYILYDTSRILHHYPVTAHITAAIVLFTDVVLLFKHILVLLLNRD